VKRKHKFADPYMQQVSVDRVAHTIETLSLGLAPKWLIINSWHSLLQALHP
jgi:hypothetical protein